MKILVYSAMNAETVMQNFGEPEYSYYFVLREFMPLLHQFGEVQQVEDPSSQVDPLYEAALGKGQECVFLSFSPPHLTCLGLACPTIPVFAWEFSSMPSETWWDDRPEHDWRWCLQQCAGAIVHSEQSAQVVRQLMGADYPVAAIPAPLWDRMACKRGQIQEPDDSEAVIEIARGTIFDTHAPGFERWLPDEQDIIRDIAEVRGLIPTEEKKGFRRASKSIRRITLEHMVAWYQQVMSNRVPDRWRVQADAWAARNDPWQLGRRELRLSGVVFTSLFNPRDGRKNWLDMLTAFCTEFRDEPGATLVFKLGHRNHEEALESFLKVFPRLPHFRCRVILLHGFLDDAAYLKLMQRTQFALNASHGEGQCLPLMEYLSYGKPAVAPQHSALADYVDTDNAFIIDSWADATMWPHDPRIAYRTLRQQIDWASLCRAYRAAFECYREQPDVYQGMARAAESRMQQHCSLTAGHKRLSTFLQSIMVKNARMIPEWLRVPCLEEWQRMAGDPGFHDSRNVGLVDAVHAGWFQNDTGELFRGFPIGPDDVVLDVGCGAGGATLFSARQGAQVIYCDIDPGNIGRLARQVRETATRQPQGIVSDCTPLPLNDGIATRVIAMEMLEHVDDPAAVLAELARVGKPAALYLITVPDAATERMQIPLAPAQHFRKPNHIHIYEPDELAQLITEAGLEVLERSSYGFFWTMWMCMHWVCEKTTRDDPENVSLDNTQPPYYPLLDSWASVWGRLISLPEAAPLRQALDEALPKSRVFIARKPVS